jgi:hypothetical protein
MQDSQHALMQRAVSACVAAVVHLHARILLLALLVPIPLTFAESKVQLRHTMHDFSIHSIGRALNRAAQRSQRGQSDHRVRSA